MSSCACKIPITFPWITTPRPTGMAFRICFAHQLELRSGQHHDCDCDMPGKVLCSQKNKVSSHSHQVQNSSQVISLDVSSSGMAVGKVCRRLCCPQIWLLLYTIEQASIKRQEGYQEKGSRPLLPQRSALSKCYLCPMTSMFLSPRLVRHQSPIHL